MDDKMWESSEKKTTVSTHEVAPDSIHTTEIPRRIDEPKVSLYKHPLVWWKQNQLSWRLYVTVYAGLALIVCFINIIAVAAAAAAHGVDKGGRITLYEGSCATAKKSGWFAHLFISGLGTYMLSASAYVMVCIR